MFSPKPFKVQVWWWKLWARFQERVQNRYLKGKVCQSCGAPATVLLPEDMSTWCSPCDGSAERLGYNTTPLWPGDELPGTWEKADTIGGATDVAQASCGHAVWKMAVDLCREPSCDRYFDKEES